MQDIIKELRTILKGEVSNDAKHRKAYMHDASIYEMTPEAIVFAKGSSDINKLVKFVNSRKSIYPNLSITPRSAGTDMSGGPLSDSLVLDMTRYFTELKGLSGDILHVEPGVYVRNIDKLLSKNSKMLGSAPASRAICTIGGMVANNSGGEQSLRFGNTERSVRELRVILADGNEYLLKPLTRSQLNVKMKQKDFEGNLYKKLFKLIEANYDLIKNARPKVNKNSMGYNLWSVWDRDTGIFDMTRLFSGSQGTLGIITDIKLKVFDEAPHSGLLTIYLNDTKKLGDIIKLIMNHSPATFEGFDDITFNLGIRYFADFRKQLGTKEYLKQQLQLMASVAKFKSHLPNMVLMVQFEGKTIDEVVDKIVSLRQDLTRFKVKTEIEGSEELSRPFWEIRRAGLSLLRNKVHNHYPSPFIDDMAVQPKYLPLFLPEVRRILRKYKLPFAIQGHFGDGNFHIFPLLKIERPSDQMKLEPVMRELIPLVIKYKGTMAGEHNDGMVRGPWLRAMFGEKVFEIFKNTKEIFDPMYIFNPNKKTDASWDFSMDHLRTNEDRNLYK